MEKLKIIEKLKSYMTKANGEKAWDKYIGSQLEEDIVNFITENQSKHQPDSSNYYYLKGFVDGYGGEEPHNEFPDGFKDINDVWDKLYELKNKGVG